ncbi:GUN4 domain-containing protein [Roseofilum casamattae]|uniref:GUN4 domain-containing protein n=1 Tax=Roseofilum casamattae BLCC-M143 TaxID=3022442 RepID=A0ABT7C242_9CYAN|nr:GUN4 domain-containing protein [Roseofilum casamattae]MDJ1185491.1 GUN4 domain-containing protein [Roseofilum casamattae BLCC-M143]
MTEETPEAPKPEEQEQEADKSDSMPDRAIANPSARRWVRGSLLTFVQWLPLAGTGGAFLVFLVQQEWLIVLLLFPVNAVSVIWSAYSKSFLRELADIYDARGKQDAQNLIARMDRFNKSIEEVIKWRLAGVDDQYLKLQRNTCQDFTTEGFKSGLGIYTLLLNEVFVPLGLSSNFIRNMQGESWPLAPGMKWNQKQLELLQERGVEIWEILRQAEKMPLYRQLAIISWGGYGKTTLLRHITYIYSQKKEGKYRAPKLLPVLLLLRQWQSVIVKKSDLSLPQLIEEHHIPSLLDDDTLSRPRNWARNHLRNGTILVMIDGFDEVKEYWREAVSEWIGKEMNKYPQAYFILTSRPSGYNDFIPEYKLKSQLFIHPFNRHQQERFIHNWYGYQERYYRGGRDTPEVKSEAKRNADNLLQQLESRPKLNDLAKIPLLLNLIVNLHRSYPGEELPKRRSDLYRKVVELQLKDRPLFRKIELLLPADEAEHVLQRLALYMVQENKPEIDYRLLYECIKALVQSFDSSVNAKALIRQLVEVSELLVKRDDGYQFAHLSFQGYLAAKEIIRTEREKVLIENWQESWWRETILLYAAQVNPDLLLQTLINIGSFKSVTLAYDCLKETPRKVDPEIEKGLQKSEAIVIYLLLQNLEYYLRKKEWKSADEETSHIILKLGDDDNKGYLNTTDLRNFPRDELQVIDELWIKYSDGKFGFSVQQKIWLNVGGELGVHDPEIWTKYCDKIGWNNKGMMDIFSSNINWNINALKGHLPALQGVVFRELFSYRAGGGYPILFSRI